MTFGWCYLQYELSVLQVLLGSDHAAADGGKPHHHPCGHHLLQGRAHAALDCLQCGLGHLLPHGPGPQLPHRNCQGGQHRDHPGPAADQDQVPEDLVCGGFHLLHTCGLHLPHRRDTHQLGLLQDGPSPEDRPLHQDPQSAAAATPLQTHPLHPPVGRGRFLQGLHTSYPSAVGMTYFCRLNC